MISLLYHTFIKALDYKIRKLLNGELFSKYMSIKSEARYFYSNGYYYIKEGKKNFYFIQSRATRYALGLNNLANKLAVDYGIRDLKFARGHLVVDVGANVGEFALYIQKFPGVKYVGIEPSPLEFKLLVKNLPTNYKAKNMALSDSNGISQFYLSSNSADSSLFLPDVVEGKIFVHTVRLDKLFSEIYLLKIDAEGAEYEVIKGAEKILKKISYIAVDLGFEKGPRHESSCPEVVNLLLSKGFKMTKFTPRNCFVFSNSRIKNSNFKYVDYT